MDNALSLTLDTFIKLPSLKAYCPTAYFFKTFFLHCKSSLVRFCKSLHICNSTVSFSKMESFSCLQNINKRVSKIPNAFVIFGQIRQNKEVDFPPPTAKTSFKLPTHESAITLSRIARDDEVKPQSKPKNVS